MKTALAWLLWLWIAAVIVGAWLVAPPMEGFVGGGESSRMLFFHVPMAWTSFVAFFAAGVSSILYLMRRQSRHDHAARVGVELGLIFCLLATLTGALWAKIEWGAYWNWDPRQLTITIALVFYAAYLALRGAIGDLEVRRRLSAAYAVLGLVVAPFLFFVAPRMAAFSLHPEPVLNAEGELRMDPEVLAILVGGSLGFMALFFWMRHLGGRLAAVAERNERDFWEVVDR